MGGKRASFTSWNVPFAKTPKNWRKKLAYAPVTTHFGQKLLKTGALFRKNFGARRAPKFFWFFCEEKLAHTPITTPFCENTRKSGVNLENFFRVFHGKKAVFALFTTPFS